MRSLYVKDSLGDRAHLSCKFRQYSVLAIIRYDNVNRYNLAKTQ
jgi:hypothetical protein